jgi:hypothetical protein
MANEGVVTQSPNPSQTIARQPGVGGGKPARPILPQRLVPTQNMRPLVGNGLNNAFRAAERNGIFLPPSTTVVSNGVVNKAIVNGKVQIVGLNANVDTLQLADQIFLGRGLTASDRSKELVPGFTVRQYLAWRDATVAFEREEPGIGSNHRGKELAKTSELFEKQLVKALNVAMSELSPDLQLAELQAVQRWTAEREADKNKRREGRACILTNVVNQGTSTGGNKILAVATGVEARKNRNIEPSASVRADQQVTPSISYRTEGSAPRRGTEKSSATGAGRVVTANSVIVPNNSTGVLQLKYHGVCIWPDNQQLYAIPINNGAVTAPNKPGGWYSEVRQLFQP